VKLSYANSRILKICTNETEARKKLGQNVSVLQERLQQMELADCLEDLRNAPGRFHELTGNLKGCLACDVTKSLRLIFTPDHDPIPTKTDGGLDWKQVTAVTNIKLEDYH